MCRLRFIASILLISGLVAVSDYGEAASINIVPLGATTYSIRATDLQDSAGIELSILYDKDALENPAVTYGALTAGAMPAQNVAVPGSIRIVIITTGAIKGSGELAAISFVSKGKIQAWQPKLSPSPSVFAADGSQLAVQSSPVPSQPSSETKNEETTSTDSTTTGNTTGIGSSPTASTAIQSGTALVSNITIPASGDQSSPDRKDVVRQEPTYQNPPSEPDSGVTGSTPTPSQIDGTPAIPSSVDKTAGTRALSALKSIQSVPERFRAYKDARAIKRFVALFDPNALRTAGFVQTPDIIVTDGKSRVTVSIELANSGDTPSFSLKGANMKSIRQVTGTLWELDALPQKNKSDVRLSIVLKGERTEIPLVAVPPINQKGTDLLSLSDAALDALLVKPFATGKPAFDVNSDGKQDYLDDYILVAHWLLKQKPQVKKVKEKPSAAK